MVEVLVGHPPYSLQQNIQRTRRHPRPHETGPDSGAKPPLWTSAVHRSWTNRMRGSRAGHTLIIILLLLGTGLYIGDRFAHSHAEQRLSATLQSRLGTLRPPSVDIEGSPFLTQVAADSLRRVHILADQLGETTEAPLIFAHVDLIMTGVESGDWFNRLKVAHTEGVGRLDYAKLSSVAGAPLTYGGQGQLELTVKTTIIGREYEVLISGLPRLNAKEQTMTLSDAKISIAGVNLPNFTGQALLAARLAPIPLRGLPLNLTAIKVSAAEDGLYVDLVGDDVTVSS
jgi:DUF2993 family protein